MNKILNLRTGETKPGPEPEINHELPTYIISGQFEPVDIPRRSLILLGCGLFFVGIGLLFLFWQNDWIAAMLFWLAGALLVILGNRPRPQGKWEINHTGLTLNDQFNEFSNFDSFWIEYPVNGWRELSFRSKKWYYPYIKIPLNEADPLAVRRYLLNFLPEEKHTDSLVDILTRWLGF